MRQSAAHVQQALSTSLTSGVFIDTKVYLFSKRTSSGRVNHPRPLYANSQVLKSVPYFETRFPEDQDDYTDDYDYLSDSDLDDAEAVVERSVLTESSNLPHEDDCSDVKAADGKPQETETVLSQGVKVLQPWLPAHEGNVVVIKDIALYTFQALIIYLYTRKINFAPIRSGNKTSHSSKNTTTNVAGIAPRVSPKSIYRLADKYGVHELKKEAFNNICTDLVWFNIVDETFSRFTSRYDEIRSAELVLLRLALLSPNSLAVRDSLKTMVQRYTNGDIPHSSGAFVALFDVLLSKTSSDSGEVKYKRKKSSRFPKALEKSLVSSLTTGVFLDTRIYAASSRLHPRVRWPIYLSRTAVGDLIVNIEKCIARTDVELHNEAAVCISGPQDNETDSDLDEEEWDEHMAENEGDSRTDEHSISGGLTHAQNDKILVDVVKVGAVSTWKAVLFYLYTNEVTFAPLASQGADERKATLDMELSLRPLRPRPCSPKSLYVLADKLGISPLRDLAWKDLESKLNAGNIVTELFSKFTSSYADILAMESKFLGKTLDKTDDVNRVRDHIRSMAEGSILHGSDALVSIFFRLLDDLETSPELLVQQP